MEHSAEGHPPEEAGAAYPAALRLTPAVGERNRLTTAFRLILAIPHIIIVGGPMVIGLSGGTQEEGSAASSGGGVLGIVAFFISIFAWVAILVTGRHPDGLWRFGAFYLRWRVRTMAYLMLLHDAYPPFGDAPYPAEMEVERPADPRDRLTVFFRILLALPHLVVLAFLGIGWIFTTVAAWFAILVTGRFPDALYDFGAGVLRWTVRVEAYLLLLRDEYPPFTLGG